MVNAKAVNQAKADAQTDFDLTAMVAHPLLVKEAIDLNGPLALNDLHGLIDLIDHEATAEQTLRNSAVLSSGVFFWYTKSITSLICSSSTT